MPHETTINITKSLRVWARAISLCFVLLQTLSFSLLLPSFHGTIALHPPKLLLALSLLLRHTTPAHIYTTPSFHSIPIGPASLAERPPSSRCIESAPQHRAPHIISVDARFRYSTRTSGPRASFGNLNYERRLCPILWKMRFDRLAGLATALTVTLMFLGVGFVAPWLKKLPIPQALVAWAVGAIVSLGLYKLIANGLFTLFRRSLRLRKFVLRQSFLEGTWVGHYVHKGMRRFTIEFFDQEKGTTKILGREFDEKGTTRASWHSDAVSIDIENMRLVYTYTCEVFGSKDQQQGVAAFTLLVPKKRAPANVLDGYSADLIDGDRDPNKEHKISDGIMADTEALEQARKIFP